ncbi:MAG TPA: SusC/RagA family TonB-linked outer membrane protein, partial [Balneolaceae bacterium]|nr:SusC/RagA family TonB-linked outer membrane protein [Balneolaceae bacterium]
YYISTGFNQRKGYIRGNQLEKYSARIKVNHKISDKLQVGLNIAPTYSRNFKRSERNQVDAPITFAALEYPNMKARNDQGEPNLSVAPNPVVAFTGTPLSNLQGTEIQEDFAQTILAGNLSWDILPQLEFKSDISVELFQLTTDEKRSDITTDGYGVGTGLNLSQKHVNYNFNSTLTYSNDFGNNSLKAMIGTSIERNQANNFSVSGNGFASNKLKTLNSAASITGGGASISSYAFEGYFSRFTYSYKDKYLLTLNGRVDGSSRFGADHRYGFFPAASVGWVVSDEDFLSGSSVLDYLKVRASYGVTGNAEGIGNYPSLALAGAGANYSGTPGLSVGQLPNPDLKWEKARQLDVGIDYGFFSSRVRGSLNYYRKVTSDLLLNRPISAVNGFTSYTQNEGKMRNAGLEFSITADIFQGPFQWTSSFNISGNRNKVLSLINGKDITAGEQIVREGEPLGSFFLREFAGANPDNGLAVWYLNRKPKQAELNSGDVFKNKSRFGDRYVTTNYGLADRIIAGNPFPDFFGGFRNNFRYKGFDLGIFFQYNIGNKIYRADGEFTDTNLSSIFNQSTRQLDYWKKKGDVTDVPKPILFTSNGSQTSTRYLENGSYVRLKNLTFGYTLPTSFTRDYTVRFYVQGTNLLTFTASDFHGMDPEVTTAPSNNINQGNIFFAPAQAKTFQAGIDFKF